MSGPATPYGDGKGTNGGCLLGIAAVVVSVLLVIGAVLALGYGIAHLNDPKPTSSTSTRSTP